MMVVSVGAPGYLTRALGHFFVPRKLETPTHKPLINTFPPGQNDRHFTDDIFSCIFVNENFCILIKIALGFVTKGTN